MAAEALQALKEWCETQVEGRTLADLQQEGDQRVARAEAFLDAIEPSNRWADDVLFRCYELTYARRASLSAAVYDARRERLAASIDAWFADQRDE